MTIKKWLAALPVFNEERYVDQILTEVSKYAEHILVVDDGSSDGTAAKLASWGNVRVVTHEQNMGYGAALKTAFQYSIENNYEVVVTLDCDGQHQPQRIPRFVKACESCDIVSGSRYLKKYPGDSTPPSQRLFINRKITEHLNCLLNLSLTDAFCGFKAYRVEALKKLDIQDNGYAMPLELWVQAAMRGLSVLEVPVPLIYLDATRTFGGVLDDSERRLQHYRDIIHSSVQVMQQRGIALPECAQAAGQGCTS